MDAFGLHRPYRRWLSLLIGLAATAVDGFAVVTAVEGSALGLEAPDVPASPGPRAALPAASSRRRRRTLSLPGTPCSSNLTSDGVPCPPAPHELLADGSKQALEDLMPGGTMPWAAASAEIRSAERLSALEAPGPLDGLYLELHLPGWTLQRLHSSHGGSLTDFLRELHLELSSAGRISSKALSIQGIHERFRRFDQREYRALRQESGVAIQHLNEEVLVRFRVQPKQGEPSPQQVAQALKGALEGSLLQGRLSQLLQNATVSESRMPGLSPPRTHQDSMDRMSAMVLPMGISAAFTGILVWLAAW